MPDIIGFDHKDAVRLEVAGGKGASLARSAQVLPVPPGVIIVADAYRTFMTPIEGRVRSILDTHGDPREASERIQRLMRQIPIDSAWLVEIDAAMSMHGIEGGVAVRSSGTMEDLPGTAFAGQHDTFLGVRGAADIMGAMRSCYASLWNEHAMRYRHHMQLSHLQASMAVVV